jgi:hypothetical protein
MQYLTRLSRTQIGPDLRSPASESPRMNDESDTLSISITGNLTSARSELEQLLRRALSAGPERIAKAEIERFLRTTTSDL